MFVFDKIVGSAAVICGIWGIADIIKYAKARRSGSEAARRRPKMWLLFYRSAVPLVVGVILITNSTDSPMASWLLDVVAGMLLVWLTIEQLRSRRSIKANVPRS